MRIPGFLSEKLRTAFLNLPAQTQGMSLSDAQSLPRVAAVRFLLQVIVLGLVLSKLAWTGFPALYASFKVVLPRRQVKPGSL
jgi:hypothetical protein